MELLEGESLAQRLAPGRLPTMEAIQIALGVLGALEDLHGHGLVHRDLKPSNVFLTPHGVKLLDFGLARALPSRTVDELEETRSQLTQPGAFVGTPRYMSPEQFKGLAADPRSDLFAVAAMLFEMLTGRHAFEGGTMMEFFHATLYEEPAALVGSEAAAAVDRVIRRCLAKRPEDRCTTASAMARELLREAFLAEDVAAAMHAVVMTRLIVLPFRTLRPDADTDSTGVRHTYWLMGEPEHALREAATPPFYFEALVLASMGREGEALSALRERERERRPEVLRVFLSSLRALLEGKHEESLEATEKCLADFRDPEAHYYLARQLAYLGARERAIEEIRRAVEQGFYCPQVLPRDPWLTPLRSTPEFGTILERAETGRREAEAAFIEVGGDRLLGVRLA